VEIRVFDREVNKKWFYKYVKRGPNSICLLL
jgi:hypothetical protein